MGRIGFLPLIWPRRNARPLKLRTYNRAITCEDFERLAFASDPGVARARCVPGRNLESENIDARGVDKPGHMSVVRMPAPTGAAGRPQPDPEMIQAVHDFLDTRRLLTTPDPRGWAALLQGERAAYPGAKKGRDPDVVQREAVERLTRFFDPLTGGPDGRGWPFGRNVYISEVYSLLDQLSGVDYVTRTLGDQPDTTLDEFIVQDPARLQRNSLNELTAVEIQPDELVDAQIRKADITLITQMGGQP